MGLDPVVPLLKSCRHPWQYDKELYKKRNEAERLFWGLKGYRRVFSRLDKLEGIFTGLIAFPPHLCHAPLAPTRSNGWDVFVSVGDAFFIEENIVVDSVGNMLDYKSVKAAVSVLACQENFSAKSPIKKLRINWKKVASTINGTHTLMKVDAREVGWNSGFVLLNFAYRDQPSKPFLSLVFDRSYILKQYITFSKIPRRALYKLTLCAIIGTTDLWDSTFTAKQ